MPAAVKPGRGLAGLGQILLPFALDRLSVGLQIALSATILATAGPKELWAPLPDNAATQVVATPGPMIDTNRRNLVTTRVKNASQVGLIMMGNSITHYWEWSQHASSYNAFVQGRQVLNLGVTAEVTPGMLHSLLVRGWLDLPQGVTPKVAMVLAGTNNCGREGFSGMRGRNTPPQEVADGIRAIIQVFARKYPSIRVINLGIFPTTWHPLWTPVNQITADYFDGTQVFHRNLTKLFVNPDGSVNLKLLPDGTHPNNAGYQAWAGAVDSLLTATMAAPPLVPIKIMHIGGSVTEGRSSSTSYRRYMDAYVRQNGYIVDFIGSRSRHDGDSAIPSTYQYDFDHEGHAGRNSAWFAQNISGLLADNAPDVAVLHLGTEDILSGTGTDPIITDAFAANLVKIIGALRARNAHVKILLAQIIPIRGRTASVRWMNQKISQLIAQNTTSQSPIRGADLYAGIDTLSDLAAGGWLPSAAGAEKMARVFANAMDALMKVPVTVKQASRFRSPRFVQGRESEGLDIRGRRVGRRSGQGAPGPGQARGILK